MYELIFVQETDEVPPERISLLPVMDSKKVLPENLCF